MRSNSLRMRSLPATVDALLLLLVEGLERSTDLLLVPFV